MTRLNLSREIATYAHKLWRAHYASAAPRDAHLVDIPLIRKLPDTHIHPYPDASVLETKTTTPEFGVIRFSPAGIHVFDGHYLNKGRTEYPTDPIDGIHPYDLERVLTEVDREGRFRNPAGQNTLLQGRTLEFWLDLYLPAETRMYEDQEPHVHNAFPEGEIPRTTQMTEDQQEQFYKLLRRRIMLGMARVPYHSLFYAGYQEDPHHPA